MRNTSQSAKRSHAALWALGQCSLLPRAPRWEVHSGFYMWHRMFMGLQMACLRWRNEGRQEAGFIESPCTAFTKDLDDKCQCPGNKSWGRKSVSDSYQCSYQFNGACICLQFLLVCYPVMDVPTLALLLFIAIRTEPSCVPVRQVLYHWASPPPAH